MIKVGKHEPNIDAFILNAVILEKFFETQSLRNANMYKQVEEWKIPEDIWSNVALPIRFALSMGLFNQIKRLRFAYAKKSFTLHRNKRN